MLSQNDPNEPNLNIIALRSGLSPNGTIREVGGLCSLNIESGSQRAEEVLSDEGRRMLPLKNGAKIELGLGLACVDMLEDTLETDPESFQALLMIAHGRKSEVEKSLIDKMKEDWLIRPDGSTLPGMIDVLLSSYQITSEGGVLVNPFRLDSQEQADAIDRAEKKGYETLLRQLREDTPDTKGRGRT